MPTSLPDLRNQCKVIDGRSSPDCSVHESDDEENNDDGYFGNVGQNDFFDTGAKTPKELTEI
jgi:hypothetical protein